VRFAHIAGDLARWVGVMRCPGDSMPKRWELSQSFGPQYSTEQCPAAWDLSRIGPNLVVGICGAASSNRALFFCRWLQFLRRKFPASVARQTKKTSGL